MKKLTLEEFISRAKEVHGNKYDYSKVEYINSKTKVCIICPIHGEFWQTPRQHLISLGCPRCSHSLVTQKDFIDKCRAIYGDKYDYSKTKYVNNHTKVVITCPIHGDFVKRPGDFIRGHGCIKCTYNNNTEYELIKGKKQLREYRIWSGMLSRCYNPNHQHTRIYKIKGIKVCDRWRNSFENFYHDMGPCPENYSLDRIDNNGDYCPENCRWANQYTQSANRGEFNHVFTYQGESKVLKEWARYFNMSYSTLYSRIYRYGLPFEKAIEKDPFNKLIEIDGVYHTLKEWCELYNIKYSIVVNRIDKHGWDLIRALTQVPGTRRYKNKDVV